MVRYGAQAAVAVMEAVYVNTRRPGWREGLSLPNTGSESLTIKSEKQGTLAEVTRDQLRDTH